MEKTFFSILSMKASVTPHITFSFSCNYNNFFEHNFFSKFLPCRENEMNDGKGLHKREKRCTFAYL